MKNLFCEIASLFKFIHEIIIYTMILFSQLNRHKFKSFIYNTFISQKRKKWISSKGALASKDLHSRHKNEILFNSSCDDDSTQNYFRRIETFNRIGLIRANDLICEIFLWCL